MSIVELIECEEEIVEETVKIVVFCLDDLKARFQKVHTLLIPMITKSMVLWNTSCTDTRL